MGTLALGFALAFAMPAAAVAAVTMTLPDRADVTAKILVTVPVTVACGPYEQSLATSFVSVSIEQASGRAIARGSGSAGGFMDPGFALTCDGQPHMYSIAITADPNGPPFKGGSAIASGFAGVAFDCCTTETAAAGPQAIKLH